MTEKQIITQQSQQTLPIIRDGFIFTRDQDLPQVVYVNLMEDGAPALSVYSGKMPCEFETIKKLNKREFRKMMSSVLPNEYKDRLPKKKSKVEKRYEHFRYVNLNPCGRHTGDCVYRSLALFLGMTYQEIFWDIAAHCAQTGLMQNYRNGYRSYIERHCLRPYTLPKKEDGTKYSVGDFLKTFARSGKRYLLETSRHCTCIKDKTINDIGDCSNLLIQNVWETDETNYFRPLYSELEITNGKAIIHTLKNKRQREQ